MSGAIVQYKDVANTNSTAVTTQSASFTSNMTSGNAIVVLACTSNDAGRSPQPATCNDSNGNTYTLAANVADTSGAGDERFYLFYCLSPTVLTSAQSVTIASGTDFTGVTLFEVSGLTGYLGANGTWQTSINASNTGLSTGSLSAGSGTSFVIASSMNSLDNGSAPFYPTVGTGLTLGAYSFYDTDVSGDLSCFGYGNFSNLGTTPVHFTSSVHSTADNYVTLGIAFSTSSGAPTVTVGLTGNSSALSGGAAPAGSGLLVSGKTLGATSGLALVLGAPVPDLRGFIQPMGPGISPDYNQMFTPLRLATSAPANVNPNVTVILSGSVLASVPGAQGVTEIDTQALAGYFVTFAPGTVNYGSSQSQSFGVQGLILSSSGGTLAALQTLNLSGAAFAIQGGVMVYTLVLTGASMTASAGAIAISDFSFIPQDVDRLQGASAYYT